MRECTTAPSVAGLPEFTGASLNPTDRRLPDDGREVVGPELVPF
jgi:hypothetical protein